MFKHWTYPFLITVIAATLVFGCGDTKEKPEPGDTIEEPEPGDPEVRERYPGLDEFHILHAVDYDEMIALLSGEEVSVIYFGWSTCPWCAQYVPYFDEVGRQKGWNRIYKFNIRDTRQTVADPATDEHSLAPKFQAIVDILGPENINTIDRPAGCDGEECQQLPWFSVPAIFAMQRGEIIAQRIGGVPGHQRVDGELPPMTDGERSILIAEIETLFDAALRAAE